MYRFDPFCINILVSEFRCFVALDLAIAIYDCSHASMAVVCPTNCQGCLWFRIACSLMGGCVKRFAALGLKCVFSGFHFGNVIVRQGFEMIDPLDPLGIMKPCSFEVIGMGLEKFPPRF